MLLRRRGRHRSGGRSRSTSGVVGCQGRTLMCANRLVQPIAATTSSSSSPRGRPAVPLGEGDWARCAHLPEATAPVTSSLLETPHEMGFVPAEVSVWALETGPPHTVLRTHVPSLRLAARQGLHQLPAGRGRARRSGSRCPSASFRMGGRRTPLKHVAAARSVGRRNGASARVSRASCSRSAHGCGGWSGASRSTGGSSPGRPRPPAASGADERPGVVGADQAAQPGGPGGKVVTCSTSKASISTTSRASRGAAPTQRPSTRGRAASSTSSFVERVGGAY